MTDLELLVQDKYGGDASRVTSEDKTRLACGEPLAYVIGWMPFLDLHIDLSSKPLIPRPETEWWTKELIAQLHTKFGSTSFRLLDLCAGSGAIGLSVLSALPHARVSLGELKPEHVEQIQTNIELNQLDASRADIRTSDLFDAFPSETWNVIVANPPYIPASRELEPSVTTYEPHEALFAGEDGLSIIRRIIAEAPTHLTSGGELWLECDISHIEAAQELATQAGATTVILNDQYGRPRVLVSYFQ